MFPITMFASRRLLQQTLSSKTACSSFYLPCLLPSSTNKSLFSNTRAYTSKKEKKIVTLIPGDGIGEEISAAVVEIINASRAPIEWEVTKLSTLHTKPGEPLLTPEVIASIKKNKCGLKGPLATPIGKGHKSLNLTLRKEFDLYANVRPCLSIPGFKSRYENVDVVVIRENTEGEYCGIENEVVPGVMQSLKVITREASQKIADYAFTYAKRNGRKRVTAVHKANIMKMSDGLFLECCRETAAAYPSIEYDEMVLDNCVMGLSTDPHALDVMVLPNLYGDIVSDLCAGLIGGLGLTPSGNIGIDCSLFEAVHGTAPDIAGQNKANPTALLLSGVMMLRHLQMQKYANRIERAAIKVIGHGKTITGDLGGTATTADFTKAIIRAMND